MYILFCVRSFERQYNPKFLPADSWYMKYQTSLQLVTELFITLPKLPTAVTFLLAQPVDPDDLKVSPMKQVHEKAVHRRQKLVVLLSGFLSHYRYTLRFSWALRLVSLCDVHNSGPNCLFPMPSTEQRQFKLPVGSKGRVIFVTQFIFLIQFAVQSQIFGSTREG